MWLDLSGGRVQHVGVIFETRRSCKMSGENSKKCGKKQDTNISQLPRLDITYIHLNYAF